MTGSMYGEVVCLSNRCEKVLLLPYHNLGVSKYFALCEDYSLSDLKEPSEEIMKDIANLFINCHVDFER